jgi:hypothetical protein
MAEQIKAEFSKEFIEILKTLEKKGNYVAFELMWMTEPDAQYFNGLKIKKKNWQQMENLLPKPYWEPLKNMPLNVRYLKYLVAKF